jgi:hypothetical protein
MSRLGSVIDAGPVDPQDAALAARLVERRCGPDAPAVLAILGLDTAPASAPAPGPETGRRAVPDTFRRMTRGKAGHRR